MYTYLLLRVLTLEIGHVPFIEQDNIVKCIWHVLLVITCYSANYRIVLMLENVQRMDEGSQHHVTPCTHLQAGTMKGE